MYGVLRLQDIYRWSSWKDLSIRPLLVGIVSLEKKERLCFMTMTDVFVIFSNISCRSIEFSVLNLVYYNDI